MRTPFSLAAWAVLAPPLAWGVPNDQFANAVDLGSAVSASASFDARFATRQVGEPPHHGDSSTGSLWWTWTAPADGRWTVSYDESLGGSYDLALYVGEAIADLSLVGEEGGDPLSVEVTAGTRYRLALAANRMSALDFAFRLHPGSKCSHDLRPYP